MRAKWLIGLAALVLAGCASGAGPSSPSALARAASLEITGQVVRADAVSDTPIRGITLYLYELVPAGTKGAQWISYGSGTTFSDPQGFWTIRVATGRSESDGSFRFSALRSGDYVLWVVPDALKGCSRGAVRSLHLSPAGMEPLLVRAL